MSLERVHIGHVGAERRRRIAAASAVALLVLACAPADEPPATTEQPPILVVAVDGLEWDVMLPMLARGELPAIAALMERGNYGLLRTLEPTLSPIIWTTIATGRTPEEHGVTGFAREGEDGALALYTNRDRRVKAVWDVASEYGKRSAVIGWWMTWPVDPIDGVMVAQTNTLEQLETAHGRAVLKGRLVADLPEQVYPASLTESVMERLGRADASLRERSQAAFGDFPHALSELGRRLWSNCLWSFRADLVYAGIADELLAEERFDLALVYLGGPDVVGHRFWRYHEPGAYAHPPAEAEVENFGAVIERQYAWVDGIVGRLVERVGPDARIVVLSDHGMHAVNLDARFDPDDPPADVNSAHHLDAPPGVLIVAGPDLAPPADRRAPGDLSRTDLPVLASVFDVAPMLLTLLDVPVGRDLRGELAPSLVTRDFLRRRPPRSVATHEDADWTARHTRATPPMPGAEERLDELRALGYLPADVSRDGSGEE